MSEPTRPPGRPALAPGDRSVGVCVKLPAREYEALYRRSQEEHVSVPELLRRHMREADEDDDDR